MILKIDTEFQQLIPPLTEDEYAGLKESIQKEGCRDPLVIWNNTIIDGHNRYDICQKLGVSFKTVERLFNSKEEVKLWILQNQLSRRNINAFTRSEIVSKIEAFIAEQAKQQQGQRTDILPILVKSSPVHTQEKASKLANTSKGTYYKAKKVLDSGRKDVIELARKDEISVNRAYELVVNNQKITSLSQAVSHEWNTPVKYLNAAKNVLGEIDIDPASNDLANKNVGARFYYTEKEDGLSKDWHGKTWLNPPYKGKSSLFVTKLLEQYEKGNVPEAILLLNANSTETAWFAPLWDFILCFTDHRINFEGTQSSNGSTHGSVFVYIGPHEKLFYTHFNQFGYVVKRVSWQT